MATLELHWPFHGNSDEVMIDLSNYSRITYSTDTLGYGSGINRYAMCTFKGSRAVTSNSYLDQTFGITRCITFWIYPLSGVSSETIIVNKGKWAISLDGLNNGKRYLKFSHEFDNNDGEWRTLSYEVVVDRWNFCVVAYNNTDNANNPDLYVNDNPKAIIETSNPSFDASDDSASDFIIGAASSAHTPYFYIRDLKLWGGAWDTADNEYPQYQDYETAAKGQKELLTNYPVEEGLESWTTKQTGKKYLHPEIKQKVSKFKTKGIYW